MARVFRRSLAARAFTLVAALAALGLVATLGAASALGANLPTLGALLVLAASALAALGAFGDRYTLDEHGISYANAWARRWVFAPRRMGWEEVESARALRGKMLVVRARGGARLVVDGVEGFEELERLVGAATGSAPASPSA